MPDPGDVVTVDFMGATGIKRRPAVVVSSQRYHQHRPDLVLGVLTALDRGSGHPVAWRHTAPARRHGAALRGDALALI